MSSVWEVANRAKEAEGQYAALGLQYLQKGRADSAMHFFADAGRWRAEYYDYCATGDALRELYNERLAELRRRVQENQR